MWSQPSTTTQNTGPSSSPEQHHPIHLTTSIHTTSFHLATQSGTQTEIRYPGPAGIAAGCKRFAPSKFALPQHSHTDVGVDHRKIVVWEKVREAATEEQINTAAFPCRIFMNYLAYYRDAERIREKSRVQGRRVELIPHPRGHQPGHDDRNGEWIDVPVTDEEDYPRLTMTDIRNMDESWGGRELGMAKDTGSSRGIVAVTERVLERAVQLRAGGRQNLEERLNGLEKGDSWAGVSVVKRSLNERCPEIGPTKMEEFLRKY
ncbi:hypothetical protein BDW71DRAFT_197167 [Aspergillus fruticulosus]